MNIETIVTMMAATWARVMDSLETEMHRDAMSLASRGFPIANNVPSDDDDNMQSSPDVQLFDWLDDLESRCGYDVSDMRAEIVEYCELRATLELLHAGYNCEDFDSEGHVRVNGAEYDCFIDARDHLMIREPMPHVWQWVRTNHGAYVKQWRATHTDANGNVTRQWHVEVWDNCGAYPRNAYTRDDLAHAQKDMDALYAPF